MRCKVVDATDARLGSRILDVATGTGEQALAFAQRGYEVVGVDISTDMLRIANEHDEYTNVTFALLTLLICPLRMIILMSPASPFSSFASIFLRISPVCF